MTNFMLSDVVSIAAASLLFPLFLLIPGYVLGWALDLFDFRASRFLSRVVIGIVLSAAVFPVVAYLTAYLSFIVAWLVYAALWIAFVWLMVRDRPRLSWPRDRWISLSMGLILLWIVIAILSLADLQIGKRAYFSVIAYDYTTRVALTDAVVRTGVPPTNPHFYPGHPADVSYFYYWSVMCALVSRLTGGLIDARIAFSGGAVWSGLALRAIAVLYCRERFAAENPKRNAAAVLFLLFVTGLDVIFIARNAAQSLDDFWKISEGWNGNSQITAWTGAALWTPHHVASLIAGLTGVLLFQTITPAMSRCKQAIIALVVAFSLASAVGMSVYVTLIFAVFWTVWFVIALFSAERRYQIPWIALIGAAALLLSALFFADLLTHRDEGAASGSLFELGVRPFNLLPIGEMNAAPRELLNLLLLPINYVAELGFFLLAGLVYPSIAKRRVHLPDAVLLLSSIGICSFVRSSVIASNDLGWRGFMPAQFILLIWSSAVLLYLFPRWTGLRSRHISRTARRALLTLLAIGVLSTLVDVFTLRLYYVFNDEGWLHAPEETTPDQQLGARTYALREAYDFIHDAYPMGAVVQHNPDVEIIDRYQGLYSFRQTVAAGPENGTVYGVTPARYDELAAQVMPLFDGTLQTPQQVFSACRDLHIDALVIKDTDLVWDDPTSWIWHATPEIFNNFVRIFAC